jgi:hypothetical protein
MRLTPIPAAAMQMTSTAQKTLTGTGHTNLIGARPSGSIEINALETPMPRPKPTMHTMKAWSKIIDPRVRLLAPIAFKAPRCQVFSSTKL